MDNERSSINSPKNKETCVVRTQLLSLVLLAIAGASACNFRPNVDYIPTRVPLTVTAKTIPVAPLPTSTLEQKMLNPTSTTSEVATEVLLPTTTPTPEVMHGDGVCDLRLEPDVIIQAGGEVGILTEFSPKQDMEGKEDQDCFVPNHHYLENTYSEFLVKFWAAGEKEVGYTSEELGKHRYLYVTNGLNEEEVRIELSSAVYPDYHDGTEVSYEVESSIIVVK